MLLCLSILNFLVPSQEKNPTLQRAICSCDDSRLQVAYVYRYASTFESNFTLSFAAVHTVSIGRL